MNSAGLYRGGINGWRFWKVATTGKSLWDIRNEYRASLGEDIGGDEPGEDIEASELIEAQLTLAEAPDGADDG